MAGALTTKDGAWIRGWAALDEDVHYTATVHLVHGNAVLASELADGQATDGGPDRCFAFDVAAYPADTLARLSVMIGETGEYLQGADVGSDAAPRAALPTRRATYRDALASGLTPADVIGGLYIDILSRPVDRGGADTFGGSLRENRMTLDQIRRALIESDEYRGRSKRIGDAAGRAFSNGLITRTAERVIRFEPLLAAFLADPQPLAERLTRYFPALHVLPGARDAVDREAAAGLPDRELFFRALALLARRPSLVLPAEAITVPPPIPAAGEVPQPEPGVYAMSPTSRLLYAGWNRSETGETGPCRWMEQIGIVADPTGGRRIQRIEIGINGAYGANDHVTVLSDRFVLDATYTERAVGGRTLVITSRTGPFQLGYLVLIAHDATSPVRRAGYHDLRLISLNVADLTFVCAAEHR